MNIRPANIDDVPLILSFIQKKSEFDRNIGAFSGELQVSEEKICRTIFGELPFAYVVFVENAEREIGFALYAFRYSSFAGQPSLWLDDLYIEEKSRSQGAGLILMNYLAEVAKEQNCTHLAWTADARNIRGLNFYHRLGAEVTEKYGNRCFFKWVPTP